MNNSQLINTYIDNIDNLCIHSHSAISLLYSLINLNGKNTLDGKNARNWNKLKNSSIDSVSFYNYNSNLDIQKNYIKEFIDTKFKIVSNYSKKKCGYEWYDIDKTNFLTLTISFLYQNCNENAKEVSKWLESDIITISTKIKDVNKKIAKSTDVNKTLEYTSALMKDFNILLVDDKNNQDLMFSWIISDYIEYFIEQQKQDLKDSTNSRMKLGGVYSAIATIGGGLLLGPIGALMIAGGGLLGGGIGTGIGVLRDRKSLNELCEFYLFFACCYIVMHLNTLTFELKNNCYNTSSNNDDFDFDKI